MPKHDPADSERFAWLTAHPLIVRQERELLSHLPLEGCVRVLEVGCGEGATLVNMPRVNRTVGVDISQPKCAFALHHTRGARFACADAASLPFKDEVFDLVFCRDVFHHVEDRIAMAREMSRVCKNGGEVVLLEAHGRNPVWFFFGGLCACERGVWRNTESRIRRAVASGAAVQLGDVSIARLSTSLFLRLLLNYRFAWKRAGGGEGFLCLAEGFTAVERRILPKIFWPYLIVRARKHSRHG